MKLGHTRAVALAGVAGTLVDVEAHIASGLPTIAVSGLPDKACGQAPDRIRSAASAAGVAIPTQRIVVNLSPASITKHGSLFDLPIAIAVLAAAGVVRSQVATDAVHLGELGLDGSIRGVRGVLPCVLAAARAGVEDVVAVNVTGSIDTELEPGDLLCLDDFIDFTRSRVGTFHDGSGPEGVVHVDVMQAYHPAIRREILDAAGQEVAGQQID